MEMEKDKKIIVIYIGVEGLDMSQIESYIRQVSKKITPSTFEGEIIIIPIHSRDTRIECINPKYVTSEALINEHNKLMNELNEVLHHQITQLK